MARNDFVEGVSGVACELISRCGMIAAMLFKKETRNPVLGEPYPTQTICQDYQFKSTGIYQTKSVRVLFNDGPDYSDTLGYDFVVFNRSTLSGIQLSHEDAPKAVWEIHQITHRSESRAASSHSPIQVDYWLKHFPVEMPLPIAVLPSAPVTGSVSVLEGDYSGGFALRVNFQAESEKSATRVVESFPFKDFHQYCIAQSLAVRLREAQQATVKLEVARKEFGKYLLPS